MSSKIPAVVGQHLDSIHCLQDGKLVLGSSDLTGRYWNGSVWYFESVQLAPNVESSTAGIELSSGVCDIAIYNKDKIAVALDSGGLEFYHLTAETPSFNLLYGAYEHDDFITSLSITSDSSNLISVGADKCVKIWNLETGCTTHTFRPAHAGTIWQVSCSLEDPQLFITCGQDGKLLLFDWRLPKPATVLDSDPLQGEITSVTWRPSHSNNIVVGDESGLIALKDIRNSKCIYSWKAHNRRIFRMLFCKEHSSCIASCADDTFVHVYHLENEKPVSIYTDNRHDDFVRGIAWNDKFDVISCGWDKKVLQHDVRKAINEINT